MSRTTAALATMTALTALLLLAACNGAADPTATPTPTAAVGADAEVDAEVDADTETDGTTADADVISSAVDATIDAGSATFTAEATADGETLQSDGVVDFAEARRQLTFATPAGDVHVLVDGTDAYLRVPGDDGGWMRLDLAAAAGGEEELRRLGIDPRQDPTVSLELLRGATGDVTEVGDDTVDGVSTTHYRVTVDAEQAAQQARADVEDAVEEAVAETGESAIEMEVWIDDEQRIRRISKEAAIDAEAAQTATVVVELDDFGTSSPEPTPTEDELIEIDPDLIRQLLADMGVER